MFILCYEHRHGTDNTYFPTRLDAELAAACILLDYFDDELDLVEQKRTVLKLLLEKKYEEAMSKWTDWTTESINVTEVVMEKGQRISEAHVRRRAGMYICQHCGLLETEHADDAKCLFEPTEFEPTS